MVRFWRICLCRHAHYAVGDVLWDFAAVHLYAGDFCLAGRVLVFDPRWRAVNAVVVGVQVCVYGYGYGYLYLGAVAAVDGEELVFYRARVAGAVVLYVPAFEVYVRLGVYGSYGVLLLFCDVLGDDPFYNLFDLFDH